MVQNLATKKGSSANRSQRIFVLCLLVVLNASADYIVDLGAARDFLFLDIGTLPSIAMDLSKGIYQGDVGLSGGAGSEIDLRATLTGDIYRTADSLLAIKKKSGELIGTDYTGADLTRFIEDVDTAVARFGLLNQDLDMGTVDLTGGLTLERTDAYTVIDMSSLKLSSGTLTLNGEANDVFYIRVRDLFELSNVDVVVNGTDASRVFFIYEGSADLSFNGGTAMGNFIAPNAAVLLSGLAGFEGSVISGGGLSVKGTRQDTAWNHTAAIPESAALGLIAVAGGGAIMIHRFFRLRNVGGPQ